MHSLRLDRRTHASCFDSMTVNFPQCCYFICTVFHEAVAVGEAWGGREGFFEAEKVMWLVSICIHHNFWGRDVTNCVFFSLCYNNRWYISFYIWRNFGEVKNTFKTHTSKLFTCLTLGFVCVCVYCNIYKTVCEKNKKIPVCSIWVSELCTISCVESPPDTVDWVGTSQTILPLTETCGRMIDLVFCSQQVSF